jgi:hypothetical protein
MVYGVPPEQVIGSAGKTKYTHSKEGPIPKSGDRMGSPRLT